MIRTSVLGKLLKDLVRRLLTFFELPGLIEIQQFPEQ